MQPHNSGFQWCTLNLLLLFYSFPGRALTGRQSAHEHACGLCAAVSGQLSRGGFNCSCSAAARLGAASTRIPASRRSRRHNTETKVRFIQTHKGTLAFLCICCVSLGLLVFIIFKHPSIGLYWYMLYLGLTYGYLFAGYLLRTVTQEKQHQQMLKRRINSRRMKMRKRETLQRRCRTCWRLPGQPWSVPG